MALIEQLLVRLGMESAGFEKGAKKAKGETEDLGNSFGKLAGIVAGLGAAIGAGALLAGLKSMVDEQMEAIDETGKLSDALGVATDDLVRMQHAAAANGAEVGTMNDALQTLSFQTGMLAQGSDKAEKAFSMLGLSLSDVAGLDTAAQFSLVAQRISEITDANTRAAVATKIFGGAGKQLLPLLMQGKAGLKAAADEAERLGIVFDRVDAAQVEMANDAVSRLGMLMTGFAQKIAIEVAPAIEVLATKVLDFATSGITAGEAVSSGMQMAVTAVGYLANALHAIAQSWKLIQGFFITGLGGIGQAFFKVAIAAQKFGEKFGIDAGMDIEEMQVDFEAATNLREEGLRQVDAALQGFDNWPSENMHAWFDDLQGKIQEAKDAMKRGPEAAVGIPEMKRRGPGEEDPFFKKAKQEAAEIAKSVETPMERMAKELAKAQTLVERGFLDPAALDKLTAQQAEALAQQAGSMASEVQLSGAMEAGSSDAFSAINRFQAQGGGPDDIKQIQQSQLRELQEAVRLLREANTTRQIIETF